MSYHTQKKCNRIDVLYNFSCFYIVTNAHTIVAIA